MNKKSSVPYGAKLRKDMGFGLLIRGTNINRDIGHSISGNDVILWRDG